MRTVPAGIVSHIGHTPLLRVRMFEREFPGLEVRAKAEWFNPGGSVKDRPALSMIEDGERRGALTKDRVIIDSTSGNTGIAYALVGAAKGYRVKLVMPGNVSAERKALVAAFGAEIVYSDAGEGSDGAIRMVSFAASLGGVETTISYPEITSHRGLSPAERAELGVGSGTVRVSTGIEAVEDIVADFEQALAG